LWLPCDILFLKKDVNGPSKVIIIKNDKKYFLLASFKATDQKRAGSGAGSGARSESDSQRYRSPDPDLYQYVSDLEHRKKKWEKRESRIEIYKKVSSVKRLRRMKRVKG
jgi:hypothetical protein